MFANQLLKLTMKKLKPPVENNYQLRFLTKNDIRELLRKDIDTIVDNIQKIMKENSISQEKLADAMMTSQQHLSYMLKKRGAGITIKVMGRFAAALNTSISELSK